MKLTAFTICYNSADYLDYVIRSALEWVDEIVVVEGAFQIGIDAGCRRRSQDETLNIMSRYHDNAKVVLHITDKPCQEHKDQYQLALDIAKRGSPDWCILIDSDEIYPQETQRVIRKTLEKSMNSGIYGFRVHSYNFINNFRSYYNGVYPRIYRCTPDAKFVYDNEVEWSNDGKSGDKMSPTPPDHISSIPAHFRFFHYAYVKEHAILNAKARMMWEKDNNPDYNPKYPKYRAEEGLYRVPDGISIMKFMGEHPPIMADHPNHV